MGKDLGNGVNRVNNNMTPDLSILVACAPSLMGREHPLLRRHGLL